MADSHVQQSIEWLDWYNQQYGAPQKDPSVVPRLTRAIADYLHWMQSVNYTPTSRHQHRMQLELFLSFVKNRRFSWQQLFTEKTREHFKKIRGLSTTAAVNGLSRYLVEQGQLKTPLPQHPQQRKLGGIYKDYLQYRQDGHQTDTRQLKSIRRVLSALCDYFNQHGITLQRLRIEALDAFMAEFCQPFLPGTCSNYRSIVRGFLSYLHQHRGILKKDFYVPTRCSSCLRVCRLLVPKIFAPMSWFTWLIPWDCDPVRSAVSPWMISPLKKHKLTSRIAKTNNR
jgi:hypothetical protein